MSSFGEKHIIEVLTKENERYRLSRLGFFSDIEKECEFISILTASQDEECDFSIWKSKILREYYRAKGFAAFCKIHISDPEFENMILRLLRQLLEIKRRNSVRTETDIYLAPENGSMSYSLPREIFNEIYPFRFPHSSAIGNTFELDNICSEIICEHFPLQETRIIDEMKNNNGFFWEKFYIKLKSITASLCYQMSGIYGEQNIHDTWSDTCLTVNQAVIANKIKSGITAKSIISYAIGILKNKNREIGRLRKHSGIELESIQYKLTNEDENTYFNNPVSTPENFPSHSIHLSTYIDYEDEDSKRGYFIVILYNKEHPLHDVLTKGLEDKVERLIKHYVDGVSYEDMAVKLFGEKSEKELVTICAKLRQETRRLKDKLYNRYQNILKEYR